MPAIPTSAGRETPRPNRNLASGLALGVGIAAFVDEAVFHQLLHWHHFYDKSTTTAGLVSDGLFHALSWFATIGALFLLADLRRYREWSAPRWLAGVLLGMGGFQLYDGTVQHKLLRLHQIRYHVSIWPYDTLWNAIALALVVAGLLLYRQGAPLTEPAMTTEAGEPARRPRR